MLVILLLLLAAGAAAWLWYRRTHDGKSPSLPPVRVSVSSGVSFNT